MLDIFPIDIFIKNIVRFNAQVVWKFRALPPWTLYQLERNELLDCGQITTSRGS